MNTQKRAHDAFRTLVASGQAFASTLLTIAYDLYGPKPGDERIEMFEWSPPALRMQLEEDLGIHMSQASNDRLMCARWLPTNDAFYNSLPDFNDTCNVLSGGTLGGDFEPATAEEIAWGITEGMLLSPPDPTDENPFSEEIVGFIASVLKDEGILNPPDVLRIAGVDQDLIARVRYDWADDPTMFAAVWQMEQDKTTDIEAVIRARRDALLQQLQSLPLQRGRVDKLTSRLRAQLRPAA